MNKEQRDAAIKFAAKTMVDIVESTVESGIIPSFETEFGVPIMDGEKMVLCKLQLTSVVVEPDDKRLTAKKGADQIQKFADDVDKGVDPLQAGKPKDWDIEDF